MVREFTGQLDAPAVREFTGELDPPAAPAAPAPSGTVREFTGDLDLDTAALEQRQEQYEKDNPFFTRLGQRIKRGYKTAIGDEFAADAADLAEGILQLQNPDTAPALARRQILNLSPEERAAKLEQSTDALAAAVSNYSAKQKELRSIPVAPVTEAMGKAKTFGGAYTAAKTAPVAAAADVGVPSLVQSAPALVNAIVGGRVAGRRGAAAGAGATSASIDYAAELSAALERAGVDTTNPQAVKAALTDPAFLEKAKKEAGLHAGMVGLFDAISFGIASKTLAPAGAKPLAREAINLTAQAGAQATTDMAGEAAGQALARGTVDEPGDVLGEALGGAFGAPADVAGATAAGVREQRAKRAATLAEPQVREFTGELDPPGTASPGSMNENVSQETEASSTVQETEIAVDPKEELSQVNASIEALEAYRADVPAEQQAAIEEDLATLKSARAELEQQIQAAEAGAVGSSTGVPESTSETSPPPGTQEPSLSDSTRPEPSGSETSRSTTPSLRTGPEITSKGITSKTIIAQPDNRIERLLQLAKEEAPKLDQALRELEGDGVRVAGVRVKETARLQEKLATKAPERISDYLGGRLAVDSPAAVQRAIDRFGRKYEILDVDNFLEAPRKGYRAVHLAVKMGSGLVAEVQIVPQPIANAQNRLHKIYEKWRNVSELTPAQMQEFSGDMEFMTRQYDQAYRAWSETKAPRGETTGAPSETADTAEGLRSTARYAASKDLREPKQREYIGTVRSLLTESKFREQLDSQTLDVGVFVRPDLDDLGKFTGRKLTPAQRANGIKVVGHIDINPARINERARELDIAPERMLREVLIHEVVHVQRAALGRDMETTDVESSAIRSEAFARNQPDLIKAGTFYANPVGVVLKGYQRLAQRALDFAYQKVGHKFSALKDLPAQETFLTGYYRLLGRLASIDEIGRKVYGTFSEASSNDQAAIYAYLTGKNVPPTVIQDKRVRERAVAVKKLIDKVGQSLVRHGLLSPQAMQAHRHEYLPRVYLKYLLGEDAAKALGRGVKPGAMGYLKQRKDIPAEVREQILGEIKDPGYLSARALGVPMRDIAILDFFESIARKREWVFPNLVVNYRGAIVSVYWLQAEAKRLREQSDYMKEPAKSRTLAIARAMDAIAQPRIAALAKPPEKFKQIPDTARYGSMRGIYVRQEIADQILGIREQVPADASIAQKLLGFGGWLSKATQAWKVSKVSLNPPAQIRNAVSNMVLLHLSGTPLAYVPVRLAQAVRSIRGNGKHWRVAQKYGVTETTFAGQEFLKIEREMLDMLARQNSGFGLADMKNLGAEIVRIAGDSYQMIEAMYKTAKIIDAMEREGLSEEKAALAAQEALFDYSLVPQSVKYLRSAPIGVPFLTFYYKVTPLLLKTAILRPWAYLPYMVIPYFLAQMIAEDYDVEKEDLDQLRVALPKWLRERGHTMFLPWKDENGRWQVLDYGYFMPWSMHAEFYNEVAAMKKDERLTEAGNLLSTLGILGGPVPNLVTAIQSNKDPFTRKEIADPADPPAHQLSAWMQYLWRLGAPTWLTDIGAGGHVYRAVTGHVNPRLGPEFGEQTNTLGQALARAVGVNLYPIDPEASVATNLRQMKFELDEVKSRMKQRLRDPNLKDEQREQVRADFMAELELREAQLRAYQEAATINPKLLGEPTGGKRYAPDA